MGSKISWSISSSWAGTTLYLMHSSSSSLGMGSKPPPGAASSGGGACRPLPLPTKLPVVSAAAIRPPGPPPELSSRLGTVGRRSPPASPSPVLARLTRPPGEKLWPVLPAPAMPTEPIAVLVVFTDDAEDPAGFTDDRCLVIAGPMREDFSSSWAWACSSEKRFSIFRMWMCSCADSLRDCACRCATRLWSSSFLLVRVPLGS
mmetsp:Transcript_2776/g.7305  ORF Transcript_2776/g.7305 Transcript_2776/m.7305 type:complete len:203 (-) Transcript_2776:133-741(-)